MDAQTKPASDDDAQLAALGYETTFVRSMSLWENFALGFTYLSPVVGAYSLFAYGMTTGGPPMVWSYPMAAVGMMMVCLVFGEVVSQFPISGGVYPWARRLVGRRWSWMTGWIYAWAMYATIAGVAVGAASFLAPLLGIEVNRTSVTLVALVTIALATAFNLQGTTILARVAMVGFVCEILGAIVVGALLLTFHRAQPLNVFVHSFGVTRNGSYAPAFLTATLVGMFCCYGFEACGDLAEETPDPGRAIPRAMRMTIYIGISVTIFSVCGLVLAIPNMADVVTARVKDPVSLILNSAFGPVGYRVILAIVMVSFVSCVLSLQAAVSRLLFSYARDRMVFASTTLARMSPKKHVPVPSLIVAGAIPSAIVILGFFMEKALAVIVSFAAVGIYVAFQMVVLGALYARIRGWKPGGKFRLGIWAWPVNIAALLYGGAAIVNVLWPRPDPGASTLEAYAQLLALAGILVAGVLYLLFAKPDQRSATAAGDAWKVFRH